MHCVQYTVLLYILPLISLWFTTTPSSTILLVFQLISQTQHDSQHRHYTALTPMCFLIVGAFVRWPLHSLFTVLSSPPPTKTKPLHCTWPQTHRIHSSPTPSPRPCVKCHVQPQQVFERRTLDGQTERLRRNVITDCCLLLKISHLFAWQNS